MPAPPAPPELEALARTLHTTPESVEHLGRLGGEALRRLEALVADVVRRDEQELDRAMDKTLHLVPKLLRGRVRKVLMPEEQR